MSPRQTPDRLSRRFLPTDWTGWLALLLFCAIQAVVLYNALRHRPTIGYDAQGYARYIQALSMGRFPTPADTWEFFSPPLPFLPSALYCASSGAPRAHLYGALRIAQVLNFVYSGFLLWALAAICRIVRPDRSGLVALAFLLVAMLPVYYRTFAFVRAEPLLALLFVLAVLQTLRITVLAEGALNATVWLGLIAGAMILTRQWAFFFFPALFLFYLLRVLKRREAAHSALAILIEVCLIASLAGGWFYVVLKVRHGDFAAFNRKPYSSFSLGNHPRSFFFSLPLKALLTDPVRPAFDNQALPIFYSDTWGDYWAYFVVASRDREARYWIDGHNLSEAIEAGGEALDRIETNRYTINRYLGRVNAVSLPASLLLVAAFVWGARMLWRTAVHRSSDRREESLAWIFLVVLTCSMGYAWFVAAFPADNGDTVKPTYVLHVFILLSVLAADMILAAGRRFPRLRAALIAVVALTALHNLPVCFTRFCGS